MAPIWVNALAQRLRDTDVVKAVEVWPSKIAVRYTTDISENYWFLDERLAQLPDGHTRIDRSALTEHRIDLVPIVDSDLVSGYGSFQHQGPHFGIGRRQWSAGSAIDKDIALQRFIIKFCAAGYQPSAPRQYIDCDMAELRSLDRSYFMTRGQIDFSARRIAGTITTGHFFDLEKAPKPRKRWSLGAAARNHKIVYRLARRILSRRRRTKHAILGGARLTSVAVTCMIQERYGPRQIHCLPYAMLFEQLGITSIYDPHPQNGTKAMACAILGIPYYTQRGPGMIDAVSKGIREVIGLRHKFIKRVRGDPDCTVIDFCMGRFDYDKALNTPFRSKHLLVYVPGWRKSRSMDICMPNRIVDCIGHYGQPINFFYW